MGSYIGRTRFSDWLYPTLKSWSAYDAKISRELNLERILKEFSTRIVKSDIMLNFSFQLPIKTVISSKRLSDSGHLPNWLRPWGYCSHPNNFRARLRAPSSLLEMIFWFNVNHSKKPFSWEQTSAILTDFQCFNLNKKQNLYDLIKNISRHFF